MLGISTGRPSASGSIPAGQATTWRFGADKDSDITVTGGLTVTVANGQTGGIRGDTGINGSSAVPIYLEFEVVTLSDAGDGYWNVGLVTSDASLSAGGTGGSQMRNVNSYSVLSAHAITYASGAVGAVTLSTASGVVTLQRIAAGSIIQIVVCNGYAWAGVDGSLSGLTAAEMQAGTRANVSGLGGLTFYPWAWLDGTGTSDPSVKARTTTGCAAPVGSTIL